MSEGVTREGLLRLLPAALRMDPALRAMAEVAAAAMEKRAAEADLARVICRIDSLDEAVLDLLAADFKVDWWDPEYSAAEKRRVLRENWHVHKALGTKGAVRRAVRAVYPEADIEEWFEYGGAPYCFRLWVRLPAEGVSAAAYGRLCRAVGVTKNERSHLERIEIRHECEAPLHSGGCCGICERVEIWPELVEMLEITARAHTGGRPGQSGRVEVRPELAARVEMTARVHGGGRAAVGRIVEIGPERGE